MKITFAHLAHVLRPILFTFTFPFKIFNIKIGIDLISISDIRYFELQHFKLTSSDGHIWMFKKFYLIYGIHDFNGAFSYDGFSITFLNLFITILRLIENYKINRLGKTLVKEMYLSDYLFTHYLFMYPDLCYLKKNTSG